MCALQIGAYCGDASIWLTENILTGAGALLVDVDTWAGSAEAAHDHIDFDEVWKFYLSRVGKKVQVWRGTSDAFFVINRTQVFDFIYIDGSHQAHQVLRDAVNADRVLKPGGLLAFDDYTWTDGHNDRPKPAIDAFLVCFSKQYNILEIGAQVWLQKKR